MIPESAKMYLLFLFLNAVTFSSFFKITFSESKPVLKTIFIIKWCAASAKNMDRIIIEKLIRLKKAIVFCFLLNYRIDEKLLIMLNQLHFYVELIL